MHKSYYILHIYIQHSILLTFAKCKNENILTENYIWGLPHEKLKKQKCFIERKKYFDICKQTTMALYLETKHIFVIEYVGIYSIRYLVYHTKKE